MASPWDVVEEAPRKRPVGANSDGWDVEHEAPHGALGDAVVHSPSLIDRARSVVAQAAPIIAPLAYLAENRDRIAPVVQKIGKRFEVADVGMVGGLARMGGDAADKLLNPATDLMSKLHALGDDAVGAEAYRDPMGYRDIAASGAEAQRGAAMVRQELAGKAPSLGDMVADPLKAVEHYGSLGADSLPAILAAVATRNPEAALGVIGATTQAQTYGDARDAGKTVLEAHEQAAPQALTEVAFSEIPILKGFAKDAPFAQRALGAAVAEAPGEALTQLAQDTMDADYAGRRVDGWELARNAFDAGLVGFASGPAEAIGGGDHSKPGAMGAPVDAPRSAPQITVTPAQLGDAVTPAPAPAATPVARTATPAPASTDADLDALLVRNIPKVAPSEAPAPVLDQDRIASMLGDLVQNPETAAAIAQAIAPTAAPAPAEVAQPSAQVAGSGLGDGAFSAAGAAPSPVSASSVPAFAAAAPSAPATTAPGVPGALEGPRGAAREVSSADSAKPAAQRIDAPSETGVQTARARKPAVKTDNAGKPLDLLRVIAANGGLDRESFRKQGVDPAEFTRRAGFHYVFRKNGGMTPADLREFMQQEGYLQRDSEHGRASIDDNDALDLFDRAFRGGEAIYSMDQAEHVARHTEAQREADDAFRAELEGSPEFQGLTDEQFDGMQARDIAALTERAYDLGATDDQIVGIAFDADNNEIHRQGLQSLVDRLERSRGADEDATPNAGESRIEPGQEAQPEPGREAFQLGSEAVPEPERTRTPQVTQGGLFAAPTARETVDAARRAKDARRDGRTGEGSTDVRRGDGELFAGDRPEQARIPEAPKRSDASTEAKALATSLKGEPAKWGDTAARYTGKVEDYDAGNPASLWLQVELTEGERAGEKKLVPFERAKREAAESPATPTAGETAAAKAPVEPTKPGAESLDEANDDFTYDPLVADQADDWLQQARADQAIAEGEADADRLGLRAAVDKLLAGASNAPRVEFMRGYDALPKRLREGVQARSVQRTSDSKVRVAALYDTETGRVFVFTDTARTPESVAWQVAHEIAGHHGLRTLLGDALNPTLELALQNPTVNALADAMGRERKSNNRLLMAEEALAELAAAVRTGNFEKIAQRYGVPVPTGMRATVAKAIENVLRRLRQLFTGRGLSFSDAQVRELLESAWQAAKTGAAATGADGGLNAEAAQTFYSGLAKTVAGDKAPARADAAGWRQFLDGAQARGEIKKAEREWLGVDDWLASQKGKVTRDELSEFVRANQVQVRDVVQREGGANAGAERELIRRGYETEESDDGEPLLYSPDGELVNEGGVIHFDRVPAADRELVQAALDPSNAPAKFGKYQLPGGKDYRELLLTLPPSRKTRMEQLNQRAADLIEQHGRYSDMPAHARAEIDRIHEEYNAIPTGPDTTEYRSQHWDQPNVLAHVRFNERTDVDGKRTLFLEEIQSDWHQEGRRDGYEASSPEVEAAQRSFDESAARGENAADWRRANPEHVAALQADRRNYRAVPNAPFKGTDEWAMLAFKRMVRWAAEHGYDRIAWTTGAQQAERYDLSKQVSEVEYIDGSRLIVRDKTGAVIYNQPTERDAVADVIGKEAAERLLEQATRRRDGFNVQRIAGDGLKVGGEGMRGFYDKILPAAVNKWAKRFGARVGTTRIDTTPVGSTAVASMREKLGPAYATSEQPAIDVTPAMRDAALDGLPLFNLERDRQFATTPANRLEVRAAFDRGDAIYRDGVRITDRAALRDADPSTLSIVPRWLAEHRDTGMESVDYTPEQQDFMRKAGIAPADARTSLQRARDWVSGKVAGIDRDSLIQGGFDQFHGLKRAVVGKGDIPAERNAYLMARQINMASTMEAVLRFGAPKLDGGVLRVDRDVPGLLDALKPVADQMPQWLGWMVARRAQVLKQQGRENLMSDEDIAAGLSLADGHEADFKAAALGYLKLKNAILDLAEQTGTIDPVARAAWDHAEYIPFYRDADGGTGPGTRRGLANQSSGIRTLKGGEAELRDPLSNIIQNFTRLIDSAMKNHATLTAVDTIGAPAFRKAALAVKPESIPLDQVRKHLIATGADPATVAGMPEAALKGVARMLAIKPPEGDDIVRVMRGGKAEYYHVDDPLLLRSLSSFDEAPTHMLVKFLQWQKNLLTAGATATPDFLIANALRDTGEATATSQDRFAPVWDTMRGAIDSFRETPLVQDLMMAGSSFHGGLFHNGDNDATAKALRRVLREHGKDEAFIERYAKTLINPKRLWSAYRKVAESTEMGSRVSLARKRLGAGAPFIEAAHEAKDFLDFQMHGDDRFVRTMTKVIPFLNARLQGAYRLGRVGTTKGRRGKLAANLALMATASLALMLWNQQQYGDGWDELEDWDKDANWHLMPGTRFHMRIPKPFELGLVGGTLPERAWAALRYQMTDGEQGDRPVQSAESLLHMITGTLAINPIPQGAKPIVEDQANRDFYFDSPIESKGDAYKAPSDRYSPNGTLLMRHASKGMAAVVGEDLTVSPKRLEHLWRGYTAGMGQYALRAADALLRDATDAPERPEMATRDLPVLGRFLRGDSPPSTTRYVDELYDLADKADQVSAQVKQAVGAGDEARAKRLENEYRWLLGEREAAKRAKAGFMHAGVREIGRTRDALAKLRKADAAIYESRDMTPAEKRKQLDAHAAERNALARTLVRQLRERERKAR